MQEAARQARNVQRLGECFPTFAARVKRVIAEMEGLGFRPRIQDAHRSIAKQLEAFENGASKVKFGYHNVTAAGGKPEALAVDLLDDDNPVASGRRYVITLANVAQKHGLNSGIFFDLKPPARRELLKTAIAQLDFDPSIRIGFDPTHIEATGLTIAGAKGGARPT
ncbi:MAG TPA: hypothetical protein VGO55_03900 [Allosphingosinicella sp.]|jgi:hypothetical protein|nr:hypothetical protein [Allosphingosinicella sp.]